MDPLVLNDLYEDGICPACWKIRDAPHIRDTSYLEYLDHAWDTFGALSLPLCADCYHRRGSILPEILPDDGSSEPFRQFQRHLTNRLLLGRTFFK